MMGTAPERPDISSKTNPIVKDILALRRSARRRRDEGLSLVEGFKILKLALDAGCTPAAVLYDKLLTDEDRNELERARSLGATVRAVTADVLTKVSAREGPLGCVASVRVKETSLDDIRLTQPPLLVVMEGLEKPGNLGSLARTASAGGANALLATDSQTDVFAPATVHASLGSVFDLPVVRCSTDEAIQWLGDAAIKIVAASPDADCAYFDVDLTGPIALAIGNEHRGLSDEWFSAGIRVRIPMHGPMNSLNATVAGGIVLFEALRQRAAT